MGKSTLSVSLPSEWVKTTGLKKGSLVYFNLEEDGSLKLVTNAEREKRSQEDIEISADFCVDSQMLSKILVGNYVLGRDVINIVSKTYLKGEHMDEVRNAIQGLMGIAIMEETPNRVVLQNSIDITSFSIHTLIRRLFIIASTMYQEVMDSFFKSEIKLARGASHRRNEANTIFWVVTRFLTSAQRDREIADKINIQNSMQILWYTIVAKYLSNIIESLDNIANKVIALESNRKVIGELLLSEILSLSEKTYSICHRAMNSLFSSDIKLANKVIEDYNDLQKVDDQLQENICSHAYLKGKSFSVTKYFKEKEPIEPCMIANLKFIIWSIRRMAELGSEIAKVAILKALYKQTKICKQLASSRNSGRNP